MNKVAVVYWSGTGHTQAMAEAVAKGAEGTLYSAEVFSADQVPDFDALAFGCPSMGAEQLEESTFAPLFEACTPFLKGKPIALFGSYGWGDGEWMRSWEAECLASGMVLVRESVICQDAPEEDTLAACVQLGAALQ